MKEREGIEECRLPTDGTPKPDPGPHNIQNHKRGHSTKSECSRTITNPDDERIHPRNDSVQMDDPVRRKKKAKLVSLKIFRSYPPSSYKLVSV